MIGDGAVFGSAMRCVSVLRATGVSLYPCIVVKSRRFGVGTLLGRWNVTIANERHAVPAPRAIGAREVASEGGKQ